VEGHRSYLGSITQSIVSLVPNFSICGFSHVKREGNVVAHWVENVPAQAESLYLSDLFS